jgi:predicted lipoprotein
MKLSRLIALLVLLLPLGAHAAEADYQALNSAAVKAHILPRYLALSEAMGQFEREAKGFCAGDRRNLASVRQSWLAAMKAWQSIQHVRFGPIDLFNRQQRFAFWPDPRNVAGRQMAELLAARDRAQLAPDRLVTGSVAVQGLSAAERLLWGDDATKISGTGEDAQFRCSYLTSIAANLAGMARDTRADWAAPPRDYARSFIASSGEGIMHVSPQDGTLDIFKSLYTAIELVGDHKLARPLGPDWSKSKPRLAEFWRSASSGVAIAANLDAARDLYRTISPFVKDRALDAELKRRLDGIATLSLALGGPLESVIADKTRRPAAERLRADIMQIKALLAERLTQALGIPLGFNALDGD